MPRSAFVYILASKKHGVLYTGVTSNLERRMYEHKQHLLQGFTKKYNVTRLVWFEQGDDISEAISLEKKIKNRNRQWKIRLIEKNNPNWDDLAAGWNADPCEVDSDIPRLASVIPSTVSGISRGVPGTPRVASGTPYATSVIPCTASDTPHAASDTPRVATVIPRAVAESTTTNPRDSATPLRSAQNDDGDDA